MKRLFVEGAKWYISTQAVKVDVVKDLLNIAVITVIIAGSKSLKNIVGILPVLILELRNCWRIFEIAFPKNKIKIKKFRRKSIIRSK